MALSPMVYKSNALVEAAYRLSVQEQRIVLAAISQVKRDEPVTDEVMYSVRAVDIATMAGVPIEASYSKLKDAALRLKRREVRFTLEPNGGGPVKAKKRTRITGWVQTIDYIDGEGRIELRFSKDMLPYLTELSREFTKYKLADVAKMDSAYAIRLYELLMQWSSTGQREIEIERLREWLLLEKRYSVLADLKRRVLDPAVKEINEHSPLAVKWSQKKAGRRVTHLIFDFVLKKTEKPVKVTKGKGKASGMTEAEIAALARPGETWEQVRARLNKAQSA